MSQVHTVFVVSWINPDARLADKTFEHYMREGIFEVLNAVCEATGEESVNAIGYCVGGTMLGRRVRRHGGVRRQAHQERDLFHDPGRLQECG